MLSIVKSFCVLINFLYLSTDTVSDSAVSLVLLQLHYVRHFVTLFGEPFAVASDVTQRCLATRCVTLCDVKYNASAFCNIKTLIEFAKNR